MSPPKSTPDGKGKGKAVATTPRMVTRSMDTKTRSGTVRSTDSTGSSASKLMKFESPEKKKRKAKSNEGGAKKKLKIEEDATVEIKKEEESAEDDDVAEEEQEDSEMKTIVIEHCKQCTSFKTRAKQVKEGLEKAVPGIIVSVNPDKPRRGCFEIREEGGQTFISLFDMKRPFISMKELNMEELITDIVEKIK